MHQLDIEGGCYLEIVDRDMSQLQEESSHSISQTEQAMTGMLAKLEVKFDKLELKVVKLENTAFPSSTSQYGGQRK